MHSHPTTWSSPPDDLDLQPHQVDVWRASLDASTPLSTSLQPDPVRLFESALSADEIQRAARFHFQEDRHRFIAAHGCLRDILARYLHCEPRQLDFYTNEYGKPALIPDQKIEFNLSHSGGYALIAVAHEHKVGVDVENIRRDMESLAHRYFSQREVLELMALPREQREVAFFHCWTRKEAYIKAQGLGLSLPLDSFDVSLTPNEPATLRATRPDAREAARWSIFSLDVAPGYAGALVVEGQGLESQFWNWIPQGHH